MELSQQTLLEVRPGKFGSPYIALGRIQEKSKRWVFVSSNAWRTLTQHIPEVTTILQQKVDKEKSIKLTERLVLTISKFQEKYYVGVHSTDSQGQRLRGRGLNMNVDEWQKLTNNVQDINQRMKCEETSMKRKRDDDSSVPKKAKHDDTILVKQYQWQKVHCITSEPYQADKHWFFSEKQAVESLDDYHMLGGDEPCCISNIIATREVPIAEDKDILKYILLTFLKNSIEKAQKEQCEACEMDLPGQRSHMKSGCLMEWSETVDKHFQAIRKQVSCAKLLEVYKKLMIHMKVDSMKTDTELYTLCFQISCDDTTMITQLKNEIVPHEYAMIIHTM